jgi:trehalose 6-phosphate phosphatase
MPDADVSRAADAVRRLIRGRHLLLLSDFDGTLSEFVADPAAVRLSEPRRETLLALQARPATTVGVVSGRRLDDVRSRTRLGDGAFYAGLHGLEIEGAGERFVHPEVAVTTAVIERLRVQLETQFAGADGVLIEDKALSVTVHYREASPDTAARTPALAEQLARAELETGRLRVMRGACILEFLPNIAWDKGSAVQWISERVAARAGETFTVYLGDDVTDEDAFRAVRGRGLAIAASSRASGADFEIAGPSAVEALLRRLGSDLDSRSDKI